MSCSPHGRSFSRLIAFVTVISLANVPFAFAEGSILAAGNRAVKRLAADTRTPPEKAVNGKQALSAAQVQPGGPSDSMFRGRKMWLMVGIGAAFAGIAYALDQGVEDNTPSSAGTRSDDPFSVPR